MTSPLDEAIGVLRRSARRLHERVAALDDRALEQRAYPSEWTVAQVCSHIGSGDVIMKRLVDDARRRDTTPDEFAQTVWDEWNAKDPRAQADDALVADRELVDTLTELADAGSPLNISMGPMEFDLPTFVAMRCSEHVLHTWDIDVTFDPTATLPADAVALIVDNLELIAGYTARPSGAPRAIVVHTTDPARDFMIDITTDAATFAPRSTAADPDATMPAESFIRLVYGRLDPRRTPVGLAPSDVVEQLRGVFPGP